MIDISRRMLGQTMAFMISILVIINWATAPTFSYIDACEDVQNVVGKERE